MKKLRPLGVQSFFTMLANVTTWRTDSKAPRSTYSMDMQKKQMELKSGQLACGGDEAGASWRASFRHGACESGELAYRFAGASTINAAPANWRTKGRMLRSIGAHHFVTVLAHPATWRAGSKTSRSTNTMGMHSKLVVAAPVNGHKELLRLWPIGVHTYPPTVV